MTERTKRLLSRGAFTCLALLVGILVAFPVLYGALGAFKSEPEFYAYPPTVLPKSFLYVGNFENVLRQVPLIRYFVNSFIVASVGALIRLVLAALASYAFAFFEFKGKKPLFFVFLGTMMLPADTLMITNYRTVTTMGLTNTYLGVMIVSLVAATTMFMLRQRFLQSPVARREAAVMDGCGDLRFLTSILLPTVKPTLGILYAQSFIALWNAYLWPLLITNHDSMRTVQVGITMLTTIEDSNYHLVLAGVTLALLPVLAVFLLLRGRMSKTMLQGALLE